MCDQVSDCVDNSDEVVCGYTGHISNYSGNSLPRHIVQHFMHTNEDCSSLLMKYPSLLNDLYPDCPGATDEPMLFELPPVVNQSSCHNNDHVPCTTATQRVCYPRHEICTYHENQMGLMSPCRNAGHLSNCWFHECPTMFKCPNAYCVPHHMVCDGIAQCPYEHDEYNCTYRYDPSRLCAGLFRCKDTHVCIHASQICDGRVHCPIRGEDENICEPCPKGCVCVGLSYDCSNAKMNVIPSLSGKVTTLLMKNNSITSLRYIKICSLLKLDMQWNKMKYLTDSGLHKCSELLILNLFVNRITQLYKGDFRGLSRLVYLNIEKNPLRVLDSDCFEGLSALPTLIINTPYLKNLPMCIFS